MIKGLTLGCWDLFHFGHALFLSKCLHECSHLTIGVLSDELIKEMKGHSASVPYKYRLLLLQELYPFCEFIKIIEHKLHDFEGYDIVFISEEKKDKPFNLIKPDIKSKIIFIPRTEGINSSCIRHRIIYEE